MLIVGELINASRPEIKKAIDVRDDGLILDIAKKQIDAGARIIDVNCGLNPQTEMNDMVWLIETIQNSLDIPLSIDSPSSEVLAKGLSKTRGRAMVNSITAEKSRYEDILPICKNYDCDIIALAMDENGMPQTAEQRFKLAEVMLEICTSYGISKDRLYFDPLARPISSEQRQVREFLIAVKMIKRLELKTIAGLSNVSFGLPNRRLLNRTFLSMASSSGLDACIIDPLDAALMSAVTASQVMLGNDAYCTEYLKAFRAGKLR